MRTNARSTGCSTNSYAFSNADVSRRNGLERAGSRRALWPVAASGETAILMPGDIVLGLDPVIVCVVDAVPLVLTVVDAERPRLPAGSFDPIRDRTLELAARRSIDEQVGLDVGYLEQLYTFGDRFRDPRETLGGPRFVTVGYLGLIGSPALGALANVQWIDWYTFFPWEDWRRGRPPMLDDHVVERVTAWIEVDPALAKGRRIRGTAAFALDGAPWNDEAVLERYEILYEIGAVAEAPQHHAVLGLSMALDHRRILATAIGRVRAKIKYRPVVFELLPPSFTLWQLQRTVEALGGTRLHKSNFRRFVEEGGLVVGTGERRATSGRPAETFRFRPEVIAERPDPGVGTR
jgi:hypothetical protein